MSSLSEVPKYARARVVGGATTEVRLVGWCTRRCGTDSAVSESASALEE